ncbi:MAG: aminotransferase class V-fold PLP-dependent enzyme [bacterium]|nr:aminotransferase class V-fold PLP-dependent enzyme [bacterium]
MKKNDDVLNNGILKDDILTDLRIIEKEKVQKIRADFPFFKNNPEIVYLDNAATTQKPYILLEKEKEFLEKYYSNVNRSASKFSFHTTELLDKSRDIISKFINSNFNEIFFTYNATYGLNYLALFLAYNYLKENDEVILTQMEHHSNLLPFTYLSKIFNFKIKIWKLNNNLELDLNDLEKLITPKTKVISITYMSNVLGVVNNIESISNIVKEKGIMLLIDAAQGIVHNEIDTKKIDIDFLVFSAHKLYGPTGLGVVYINKKHFKNLQTKTPAFAGGGIVSKVNIDENLIDIGLLGFPYYFEPGTPAISQIYSFSHVINYLENINYYDYKTYEIKLTKYLVNKLQELGFIELYGYDRNEVSRNRFGIVPFNVKNVHSHDVSTVLDNYGIVIRVGHHCAQLINKKLNVDSTCRVSLAFYNISNEIDTLIQALYQVKKIFKL